MITSLLLLAMSSRKVTVCRARVQALQWAAQGGGGVTDPGDVQAKFGFCVEGHGLVSTIGDGWMVGLDDLEGLFQPW